MGDRSRRVHGDDHGDDERHSDGSSSSDEEDGDLTVSAAKGMLRDILTLCERQPHKKQLAEARQQAQGDPRASMLTVVPMVVDIAQEALARGSKNKQSTRGRPAAGFVSASPARKDTHAKSTAGSPGTPEPLLLGFLREAKLLVGSDSSGSMKRDIVILRSLLSPS